MSGLVKNHQKFHRAVSLMRNFFTEKGWIEVHTQDRRTILAACEDPSTISLFNYDGTTWPLPQTGQMHLEDHLLNEPSEKGYFCLSTSYRAEPNPIPGRHETVFPMFEFEGHGDMSELLKVEKELLEFMGFKKEAYSNGTTRVYPEVEYTEMMKRYKTSELEHEHEQQMWDDYGNVVLLKNFPYHTSPFWNMKKDGDTAKKVDVILAGMETIGSAERSCDKAEMRDQFLTISDGEYAGILYSKFDRKRVNAELDKFLDRDFFPRFGGGIGVGRMINALDHLDTSA